MKAIDFNQIKEVLDRWTDKIYPSREDFLKKLTKKKLVIYHGIDPTAPSLHLGHSTNLLLLKRFQEWGHKVILLVGDFTAQIGDPSGRLTERNPLTEKEVLNNSQTYKFQAGKILDFRSKRNSAEVKRNSQWLKKFTLEKILRLSGNFTVQRIIERDMFQKRLKQKKPIWLHEFLYPLFQGYDSVALDVDVEVGGTDQTFNMMIGRDLMRIYRNKEKFVITTPLLINPKTGNKLMSKSEGNYVALDDSSEEMFGKIMALPDEVIINCFKLCTEVSLEEIKIMEQGFKSKKDNPRDLKARLAREIVTTYHGVSVAEKAEEEFNRVFREHKVPKKVKSYPAKIFAKQKLRRAGKFPRPKASTVQGRQVTRLSILDLLVKTKLAPSKSGAKRLVLQKAVKIDGKVENDWRSKVGIKKGMIVQVGKRKFIKIV